MANELRVQYLPDVVVYVVILNPAGLVWNGTTFETIADANWATYDVPLTEQGTSTGIYFADFPALITTAGVYNLLAYERAGGTPVVTDTLIDGTGSINWAGNREASTVSGYPNASDVATRLTDAGVTVPDTSSLNFAIALAISAWEKETGYEPFLAGASSTWTFEPNSTNLLDFRGGFVSITEIKTDVTYGNPTGVAKVAGRDYLLKPDNAANLGKPYEYVTFRTPLYDNNEASVTVTGLRGYCTELPDDVYEVIIRQILAFLMPERLLELTGGLEGWSEGDVQERYGAALNNPLMTVSDRLLSDFKRLALYYKRLRIVGG